MLRTPSRHLSTETASFVLPKGYRGIRLVALFAGTAVIPMSCCLERESNFVSMHPSTTSNLEELGRAFVVSISRSTFI